MSYSQVPRGGLSDRGTRASGGAKTEPNVIGIVIRRTDPV